MTDKTPKFDPTKPFEVQGESTPKFDPTQPHAVEDATHTSLGVARTGAIQGVTDVLGLPDTVGRLFTMANDKLRAKTGQKTSAQVRADIAAAPDRPQGTGRYGQIPAALKTSAQQPETPGWQKFLEDLAFKHIQKDEAQTQGEKYIQNISRAASGAALTGGATAAPEAIIGTTVRMGGAGAIGGAASEAAGQATEGTEAEPWARFFAGLIGGGGAMALANKFTTAESILNSTLRGYSADDFNAANTLMQQAEAQGMRLTPAEALAQVRGGNTPLMNVQRYAENAPESGPIMGQFMQPRGQQNAVATGAALDNVAPASGVPTEVAPAIQNAAQGNLTAIRQGINAEAEPWYQQAHSQSDQLVGLGINPYAGPQWDALTQTPAFRVALNQVRTDPLNARLANLPDYDLAVLDAVKKRMDLSAGQATNPGIGQQPDTTTAAAYTGAGRQLRGTVDPVFPDYQVARQIGQEGRERFLQPAGRAPIGQLAETGDAVTQQNILLPKLATEGSPQQIHQAVTTLVQRGAGDQAGELIRLKLQDIFDTALPNVKGNAEQFRGANFANQVTRYDNQIRSLETAVRALPGGDARWTQLDHLLQVLRAQGQRLPVGSSTEFNRMLSEAASKSGSIVTAPFRLAQTATDAGRRMMQGFALRGSQRALADALTQGSTRGLREIAERPGTTGVNVLVNALMQGGRP